MSISTSTVVQAVKPVRLRRHLGLYIGFPRGFVYGLAGVVRVCYFYRDVETQGLLLFGGFRIRIRFMPGLGWVGCV